MRYWTTEMERADGLLFGRVTYEMMESAWLKQEPGEGLFVGGVTLPLALADLGLIDEYEFVVQPVLAGHGPTLLAGLRERIQLELVDRHEFRSGAVAQRYRPTRVAA
jgi:dihydrofolate reductase